MSLWCRYNKFIFVLIFCVLWEAESSHPVQENPDTNYNTNGYGYG